MDPAIAEIVSRAFYGGDLTTAQKRRDEVETKPIPFTQQAPLPLSPIVVVDFPHVNATGSRQRLERGRPRWHNPSEVETVVDVLRLVRAGDTGKRPTLAMTRPNVLPSAICTASAPRIGIFRGSMAGLCAPLSTLRRNPRGQLRMTRGRCGSVG
jgi:AAA domain